MFCLSIFLYFIIFLIYILFLFHLIHICSNPLCIVLCYFDFLLLVLLMSFHCVACIKPLALDSLFCLLIYVYAPISIFGQFIQQHPFLCFSYFMLSNLFHFSNIMLLLMEVQIINLRAHLSNNTFYASFYALKIFKTKFDCQIRLMFMTFLAKWTCIYHWPYFLFKIYFEPFWHKT